MCNSFTAKLHLQWLAPTDRSTQTNASEIAFIETNSWPIAQSNDLMLMDFWHQPMNSLVIVTLLNSKLWFSIRSNSSFLNILFWKHLIASPTPSSKKIRSPQLIPHVKVKGKKMSNIQEVCTSKKHREKAINTFSFIELIWVELGSVIVCREKLSPSS